MSEQHGTLDKELGWREIAASYSKSEVTDVVNMTAIAVVEAQETGPG